MTREEEPKEEVYRTLLRCTNCSYTSSSEGRGVPSQKELVKSVAGAGCPFCRKPALTVAAYPSRLLKKK